ncbi:ArsR/SmtB family transcription factor [Paenibacillus tepidiphilus]|uniref:ArsR/SmtB family transcription factor n=1 Tax=Paenibacillus tepidiphilus TaxID=2608683 RepID=UPI001239246F|nr:metalloregulator ArsR/SmtB family transcription factor [Paenibacillus tepidiphilus]
MEPAALEDCDNTCNGSELGPDSAALILPERSTTDKMAEMFKALGDPTRVRLIYALSQRELCVHDLSSILDMGQSAVSHQLRYLRNLRIVKRRKEGKTVYYSLNDAHVEQIFLQTHEHIRHE